MLEYEAGILRTESRGKNIYQLELSCPDIAGEIVPGQFLQVRAGNGADPFLRRTFSVSGADRDRGMVSLLVDVVGRGTELLCDMKCGGTVNVIGPLGTGFAIDESPNGPYVLVAGGTGAAPMIFLADTLSKMTGDKQVIFMLGARDTASLGTICNLVNSEVTCLTATDDGSSGFHGTVAGLFEQNLQEMTPSVICSCGPLPMMRAVAGIAKSASIPCQVSLEERMACGFGACLGCAVELTDGRMVRSCVEGPVFNALEVNW